MKLDKLPLKLTPDQFLSLYAHLLETEDDVGLTGDLSDILGMMERDCEAYRALSVDFDVKVAELDLP